MSLDIHLISQKKVFSTKHSGIFVREKGQMKEISEEEWYKKHPNNEPVRFLGEKQETNRIYDSNITHNLTAMADAADIYYALWRPEEKGFKYAKDIIPALELGLEFLRADEKKFRKFDDPNGWGTYEQFVPFVEEYLAACREHPDALIEVSR